MTEIQFESGITVAIADGYVSAPTPTLTAIMDAIAATLPGYGSPPFEQDADFCIARGIIEKIGGGKIVRRRSVASAAHATPQIGIAHSGVT